MPELVTIAWITGSIVGCAVIVIIVFGYLIKNGT